MDYTLKIINGELKLIPIRKTPKILDELFGKSKPLPRRKK